jgi:hypothetical protein
MQLDAIRALADAHGLLVRSSVVPTSLSRKAWRHAHDIGLLVRVHPDVSRVVDVPASPELLIAAAVAAARPSAGEHRIMASGRTGAYLLGVGVAPDDPIHLSVKARPHHIVLSGVRVHRPTHLGDLVAN